ncbi:MAG TPA: hypothetical protein VF407_21050 [Polyangiaceae bacterium]
MRIADSTGVAWQLESRFVGKHVGAESPLKSRGVWQLHAVGHACDSQTVSQSTPSSPQFAYVLHVPIDPSALHRVCPS